jgi:S1-C subfamily serine protease
MQYDERRPGWNLLWGMIGIALLVGVISGGMAGAVAALLVPREEAAAPARALRGEPAGPATTLRTTTEESAVIETVKKVQPGVVTLIVQSSRTDSAGRVIVSTSLGSGVVIDPRGYVLTNFHVVDGAAKITVKLWNGEERPGVLVGDDSPFTDIALVRIQAGNLTAVPIGDSDALALGQRLVALGSIAFGPTALDFRNNVTLGVVSGLHRKWKSSSDSVVMEDLIQTDAAINHGNSGGALVNLNGELVGITTNVVRETQNGFQVQGVAFAISSRTFVPLVEEIIRQNGKVPRPYLGITPRHITEEMARQAGLPVPSGAQVVEVAADSPAARAGIRRGDIIIRLAGADVTEETPFITLLAKQRPNDTIPVTFLRGGREMTVDVTVALSR